MKVKDNLILPFHLLRYKSIFERKLYLSSLELLKLKNIELLT